MLPDTLNWLILAITLNLPAVLSSKSDTQIPLLIDAIQEETPPLSFELRHIHASTNTSAVIFQDVDQESISIAQSRTKTNLRTRRMRTHRPRAKSHSNGTYLTSPGGEWDEEPVLGPDVTDRETILELAKMTNNAYVEKGDKDWYDLGDGWDHTPFGWEPDADGFRGHVFVATDNSTVVLTIKGTSPAVFGGGGPTGRKDKLNDNLLFSCCCARVSYTWKWNTVCDCYQGGSSCGQDCVEEALIEKSLFYPVGTNLYNNLTYMYPNANIWITGHSLGGALSSLLGMTFGAPVVAFESPGEAMAAKRLHLPSPPSTTHITHFYHNADPMPMGVCTGSWSSCSLAGYAMETKCHLGQSAVFDTVNELGWAVDVRTHGIVNVITELYEATGKWWMKDGESTGRTWPVPAPDEDDCLSTECYAWDFV